MSQVTQVSFFFLSRSRATTMNMRTLDDELDIFVAGSADKARLVKQLQRAEEEEEEEEEERGWCRPVQR